MQPEPTHAVCSCGHDNHDHSHGYSYSNRYIHGFVTAAATIATAVATALATKATVTATAVIPRPLVVQPPSSYIGNLPHTYSEADVQALFVPYGNITSTKILRDKADRPTERAAMVNYTTAVWSPHSIPISISLSIPILNPYPCLYSAHTNCIAHHAAHTCLSMKVVCHMLCVSKTSIIFIMQQCSQIRLLKGFSYECISLWKHGHPTGGKSAASFERWSVLHSLTRHI